MSDTGKNNWKLDLARHDDQTPEYSTKITVNISMSDDTPPPLLEAVGKCVAEIIKIASSPEELDKISEWLEEKRASHQRRADHAARMLLGQDVSGEEPEP